MRERYCHAVLLRASMPFHATRFIVADTDAIIMPPRHLLACALDDLFYEHNGCHYITTR